MKKNDIIQIIIVVVLTTMALIVFGCRTPQPIVQTEVKEVLVERVIKMLC